MPELPIRIPVVEEEEEEEVAEQPGPSKGQTEDDIHRLKLQILLSNFNQEQLDRYEAMRRASFPKPVVKRVRYYIFFKL